MSQKRAAEDAEASDTVAGKEKGIVRMRIARILCAPSLTLRLRRRAPILSA
jgi:hypothetical protein